MHDNRVTCCSSPALQLSMHHVQIWVDCMPYRVLCAARFFTFMGYISANETLMPRLPGLYISPPVIIYIPRSPPILQPILQKSPRTHARRHCQSQASLDLGTNQPLNGSPGTAPQHDDFQTRYSATGVAACSQHKPPSPLPAAPQLRPHASSGSGNLLLLVQPRSSSPVSAVVLRASVLPTASSCESASGQTSSRVQGARNYQ